MKRLTQRSLLAAMLALVAASCSDNAVAPGGGGSGLTQGLQASNSGELVSYMRTRLQTNNGSAPQYASGDLLNSATTPVGLAQAAASASASAPSYSSTTLQEAGVDEADALKTNGTMLYALAPVVDASSYTPRYLLKAAYRQPDGSLQAISSQDYADAAMPQHWPSGLHLSDDASRLAVAGSMWTAWATTTAEPVQSAALRVYQGGAQVAVDVFATSTGVAPERRNRILIDGSLIDSRLIGNTLYLVTRWSPYIVLPQDATQKQAALSKLSAHDVLPTVEVSGSNGAAVLARQPLLADTDCYLQTANASPSTELTTITAIDLASNTLARTSRCFVGGAEAIYMSLANVYVASTRYAYTGGDVGLVYPVQMTTDVHKFSLSGLTIAYRGSGEVAGHLGWSSTEKSYRMSEYNNDLRVVSFTGQTGWVTPQANSAILPTTTPSPASLTILREAGSGTALTTVSTLPNAKRPDALGKPNEQIYGVRFVGPRGYVVTFRRIDPLYVLDLADATDPKITGQLETAGYSDYLFPLPNNLLLGVGHDSQPARVKLSLFDVANPAQPAELATRYVGSTAGASGLDYSAHGINLLTQGNTTRVALPVDVYGESIRGLARFEVDSNAKTLTEKTLVPAATECLGSNRYTYGCWMGHERSVQIESDVYYLTGGQVTAISGTSAAVFGYRTANQCGATDIAPLATLSAKLTTNGIAVQSASCGRDGLNYVCGPSGLIGIFDIPATQLAQAEALGYRRLTELPGAVSQACTP